MMFGLGLPELIIILIILLLLFGSTKLPKLSRSIGESARELRSGFEGGNKSKKHDQDNKDSSETNG